jgi:S-adenosylmethionine synthetase
MTDMLRPAEFIFPGHPDKLCDAIADALVVEARRREERALVGVEVAIHRTHVTVTGRIACEGADNIDVAALVRDVYQTAGYGDGWHPAPEVLEITSQLCLGSLEDGEAEFRDVSDDQAICIGYAVNIPETNYLPPEQWLVHRLSQRLYGLRLEQPQLELGPDGKVLILLREENRTWILDQFSCSLQQREHASDVALHRAVRTALEQELKDAAKLLPGLSASIPDDITVNGAGAFEVGGPEGDNGLSGKKLVVDAYGPRVPIGGGAWSGKDFFKADRAGGIHARRIAKLAVITGLCDEALVRLLWFPGDRTPRVLPIETGNDRTVSASGLESLLDLSLARSGQDFGDIPDLVSLARWGMFSDASLRSETLGGL